MNKITVEDFQRVKKLMRKTNLTATDIHRMYKEACPPVISDLNYENVASYGQAIPNN